MPNFNFGKQVVGNAYSLNDKNVGNVATRRRTPVTASASSANYQGSRSTPTRSGGYDITRFNPAYDRLEEGSVIEDWIPRDLPGINKMLRIIYTRDPIAGPAADIMSNLPWSEFDIQGIEDPTIMHFFEEAAQLFGDKAQEMPSITTEFLVLGRFCASLLYDQSKGYWTDYVPHDSDFLTITPIPIRNFDPKIDLILSPGIRQFVSSADYRDQIAMQQLPQHLINKMRSGQPIPLDPLNTLYIRRKSSPYDFVGTSIYTRIIPFWAVEKALMNATVTAARRRAGNILHVKAGLDDRWEPTQGEMEDIAGLFIQSDEDPVGAVVVTRTGVDAQELREGGQLWKWTDEWATFSEGKMRGLGISEALLSGDATYNNMEQARSVFTEQVRTLRSYITQQVYYRLFKTLARAHGFKKRSKAELDHKVRIEKTKEPSGELSLLNLSQQDALNISDSELIIPTMHWRKSLLPEGDKEYLDLLNVLKDQGVPIPLRVWAARGGYDIDEAMEMLDDDLKLRDKIKSWQVKSEGGEDAADASADHQKKDPGFWNPSDRFLELRKSEAKKVLKNLISTVNQPGKHEVLADADWVMKQVYGLLKTERKTQLMSYVLMRMGVANALPLTDATIASISDYFTSADFLSERKRTIELRFLANLTASRGEAAPLRVVTSAAPQAAEIGRAVQNAMRSPELEPTQPTLMSGSIR